MIINAFKNKIFQLYHKENMFEDKDENDIGDENGLINYEMFERLIFSRRDINNELVKKYFLVEDLEALLKKMKKNKRCRKK